MRFVSLRRAMPHANVRISTPIVFAAAIIAFSGFSVRASAQALKTLAPFNGTNGAYPQAPLIADAHGNLFGVANSGGTSNDGVIFELTNSSGVYATTPTVLYNFLGGNDGYDPSTGLMMDTNGNLIGTTELGGMGSGGTVFELPALAGGGYASSPTSLGFFSGYNGAYPFSPLIADSQGNVFGTTFAGGMSGSGVGVLYEILNNGGTYATSPTVLSNFGTNGDPSAYPVGALVADSNGNLFGTTYYGGTGGIGSIFEIPKTSTGYASAPVTLYSFTGDSGGYPFGGLTIDANGNLFGTAEQGGTSGLGTIFELAKTNGAYASAPTLLYSFSGLDGLFPTAALLIDGAGNLFGTAQHGGGLDYGNAFKLAKTSGGYASSLTILANFVDDGVTGVYPAAPLIADAAGNLYGTTPEGGPTETGTVFEITGAGFVPFSKFSGVPGTVNCKGTSTSALAQTYGGIAHAASALGYANVAALQTAVAAHCGN